MTARRRRPPALAAAVVAAIVLALPAAAGATSHARWWPNHEVEHLKLRFGPLPVVPGQNVIRFRGLKQRPTVPGWMTSFTPNLVYAGPHGSCDGGVPPVDVIHLHHGVWLINNYPLFAAGEEKTRVKVPEGFGYRYRLSDSWVLSYMIHNLTPNAARVCLTYDIGFIPARSRYARHIVEVRTQNMTVIHAQYPVFDVHQGSGVNGRYTFPTDATDPYGSGLANNIWRAPRDETITGMVGHLHPGGLYDSLFDTRVINGVSRTVLVFRSRAHYFEPAGSVSWDVAMMTTPPGFRVKIRKGDVLSLTSTYDSARGSWYEAMGIMPVQMTDHDVGGLDPFTHHTAVPGVLNHGHLPENDNHGGGKAILPNAGALADGPLTDAGRVPIEDFAYTQGDLTLEGAKGRPPTIHQGQSLTFINDDSGPSVAFPGKQIYHTITSCQSPCDARTGVAYPLAHVAPGQPSFDSGELGYGPPAYTPTAERRTWSTPPTLPAGTYNYFCRIHPFMRGSFRVLPDQ